ncbi:MAG: serine hydrolase domain-containing protein [Bacteroidales bacterium]|nr:serine hydrolase domain-containing protein [Bacteroidales bacterium]
MIKFRMSWIGMKMILLAFLMFSSISGKAQHIGVIDAEIMKKRLDKVAADLNLPGYSLFLGQEGNFSWTASYGYADLLKGKKADAESCYQCASITKPIAASLLLMLVNEGKLSLDDPVLPYVLPVLKQYGIPIDESVGEIKVKHLLSHTSDAPPGTYFRYDGDRYALLSILLGEVSGKSPEDCFMSELCVPFGMEHTAPCTMLDDFPDIQEHLAEPYSLSDDNELKKGSYTNSFSTSAGLVSNVKDLATFMSAYFNNCIIPEKLVKLSTKPFAMKQGATASYGLGWHVEHVFGIKTIWHAGYGYCTSGLIMYIPEFGLSFVILSNSNMLSKPFSHGLPQLSILESPVALEVFRMLIRTKRGEVRLPNIDWDSHSNDQIMSMYNNAGSEAKIFMQMEAKAMWNIARVHKDSMQQEKLLALYREFQPGKAEAGIAGGQILSCLNVNDKAHLIDTITITRQQIVRIKAIADGGYCAYFGMYDQVWIENSSGDEIWHMNPLHTEFAGGHPRNRLASLDIILPGGDYIIHYDNTVSPYNHYKGHWEAFPPSDDLWGIMLISVN